jgi:hypothetical protein
VADTPNFDDANLALRLYELRRETEMRKARTMIGEVLDGATPETFAAVATWGHPENAHFRQVTSYWEMVASFVNRGILHPDVYLDTCGEGLYTWSVLKPQIASLRQAMSPRFMTQTERAVKENPALAERVATIDAARAAWAAKEAATAAAKPKKPREERTKTDARGRLAKSTR